MDPISFYGSLFQLSNSLATVVNVALGTTAGRKSLNSTLKELPILFSLLEEMKNGVLKTTTSIPTSAALASRACQIDLDNVIECLSQRGLIGRSREVFSDLQSQLSINSLESTSTSASEKNRNSKRRRQIWKEKLNLLNVDALSDAVGSFKNSVLLLRDIAMDLQTHSHQAVHSDAQHVLINEMQILRSLLETSTSNTSGESIVDEGDTQDINTGRSQVSMGNSAQSSQSVDALYSGSSASIGNSSVASDTTLKAEQLSMPSENAKLKVEKFSTVFNVMVCIPKPSGPLPPLTPDIIFARAVLDTGCAWNIISQKKIMRHRFEYLKQRLNHKKTLTLGDGKTPMSSESVVTLSWYNTHDAMKSYTTVFYVVELERDHFDMLLGKEFYQEHGAPQSKAPTEEYMMMGFLDQVRRPKKQKKKEKQDESNAEKAAKLNIQQIRERARNDERKPPVVTAEAPEVTAPILSPVAETVPASASGEGRRGVEVTEAVRMSDGRNGVKGVETTPSSSKDNSTQNPTPTTKSTPLPPPEHTTTHEVQAEHSQASTVNGTHTFEEPGHLQAAAQVDRRVGPVVSTANDTHHIAVEDFAIPVKISTKSTNASTGSSNHTTIAPEGRLTGSKAANPGPQEVPRTVSAETKVEKSPALALPSVKTVQDSHSESSALANGDHKEDGKQVPVQPLERKRTLKNKSSPS